MPGRGTADHVWRVFEDGKEYLLKHVKINVPSYSERDGEDWNICCTGQMTIDRETSTATIGVENGREMDTESDQEARCFA